jgi:hypothetical protein
MSDRERLRDKLDKLGTGRIAAEIDARSDKTFLRGLTQLIDETVLPREVTLSAGDVRVALTVARRRLIAVAGDVTARFDQEADDAGDDTLRRLRADLVQALVGQDRVAIGAARTEIAPELQGAGPSADALAAAWGVALYGTAGGIDALAALVREKSYAWVIWDHGAAADEWGDPEYLKVLKNKVSPRAVRAQHGGDRGFVAVGGNSFATALGLAWDGQAEVGFIVARIDLAPLAQAFAGA